MEMTHPVKAEYLNIFTRSISSVLGDMVYEAPRMGRLSMRNEYTCEFNGIAIYFNITGTLNGQVVITADTDCILKIAGRMMDEEVCSLDEMAKSAISELCNMIVANATIGLADTGYPCDITPPVMLSGGKTRTALTPGMRTLVIPFELSIGDMEINISLAESLERNVVFSM